MNQANKLSANYPNITIATSLAPARLALQRRALDSWLKLGFRVVSVNTQKEIDQVYQDFRDIEFVPANRDASLKFGKPFIYLDDVLAYFKTQNSRICGIVNSDIILLAPDNLRRQIWNHAFRSLVYGPRVNVNSLDTLAGSMDNYGFDYFFFDRALIPCLPKEEFCIGLPWWDYWVPLVLSWHNVALKKIIDPIAYHVIHPGYDFNNFVTLGFTLANHFPPPFKLTANTMCDYGAYVRLTFQKRTTEISL